MHSLKDFGVTKQVKYLENGSKLVLLYKKNTPVSAFVVFLAGSRNDPKGKEGLAHFVEHIVSKKTKKFKNETESGLYLEKLGAYINAFTWIDMLGFWISIGLNKDFPDAVTYLKELIKESTFDEKDVNTERGVILREIGDYKADPSRFVYDITSSLLLQNTDAGRFVVGTKESVNNISIKDLKGFYKNMLRPDKMVVVLCGDIKVDGAVEEFNKKFSLKYEKKPEIDLKEDLPVIRKKFIAVEKYKGIEQINLGFGFRTCSFSNEDTITLDVIRSILADGFSSSLFKELRTKYGLVYSVYMDNAFFSDAGYSVVFASTTKSNLNKVLDIITLEFSRLYNGNVSLEEVKLAKDKIIKSKYRQMQSSDSWVNTQFMEELFNPRNPSDLASWMNKVSKVTKLDVVEVSRKYFGKGKWYLGLCGDIEEKDIKVNY
ncbi:insulinase family protein [candidate division WWE3 bacterium]|uniref:Insulinase family protein n=1 Tax=candidate division WWE3 bacterium TaxID=2053526 RepID=A0A7X9HSW8_UNCKA|nr:insulinase family protein [candidate division WWE3 bacterium]